MDSSSALEYKDAVPLHGPVAWAQTFSADPSSFWEGSGCNQFAIQAEDSYGLSLALLSLQSLCVLLLEICMTAGVPLA